MRSHHYTISYRQWIRLLVPPALALASLAAIFQLSIHHWDRRLETVPVTTLDDVIVEEKSRLSRAGPMADLVVIGDSSCLMDVSMSEMGRLLPSLKECNLGTLSTLGLPRFTALLDQYLRQARPANSVQPPAAQNLPSAAEPPLTPKLVVLLISPEMVRTTRQVPARKQTRERAWKERALRARMTRSFDSARWLSTLNDLFAVTSIRTAIADRLIEAPLPGHWGEVYGSFSGFRAYLSAQGGCAVDPSELSEAAVMPPLSTSVLSPALISQCHDFAKVLSSRANLAVGLTPIPQSQAPAGYATLFRQAVDQLKASLGAQAALTDLPPVLPDHYFSTPTHLNAAGGRQYSHYLSRALRKVGLILLPGRRRAKDELTARLDFRQRTPQPAPP